MSDRFDAVLKEVDAILDKAGVHRAVICVQDPDCDRIHSKRRGDIPWAVGMLDCYREDLKVIWVEQGDDDEEREEETPV